MAFCDTLKSEIIIDKNESGEYLFYPQIVSCASTRHDVGRILSENKNQPNSIEFCWSFQITKEKYRIRCSAEILKRESADKTLLMKVWN